MSLFSKCCFFPKKPKTFSLRSYPQSLSDECTVNLLEGNQQRRKRYHLANFKNKVRLLFLKGNTWRQGWDVLAFKQKENTWKTLIFPSWSICFDLELFVFVLASVHQVLNTWTVTKHKVEQKPLGTSWIALKGNKQETVSQGRLFRWQHWSCPHVKLSCRQVSLLDGVEPEVLLSDFAQQLRRKYAEVPDF